MKKIMALPLLWIVFSFSGEIYAADTWGPCEPVGGVTFDYPVSVNIDIADATKNKAGTTLANAMTWANGTRVAIQCECPSSYSKEKDTLIAGDSELPNKTRTINSFQYFKLTDELDVSTIINISRSQNGFVPFGWKQATEVWGCNKTINAQYMGSNGTLSFYITQPFKGVSVIPRTTIAKLYAGKAKTKGTAVASVTIAGNITITQGCEISPGTVLDVPFGSFPAASFKNRKGVIPVGGVEKEINLKFDCNNIADGIKVSLRLEGATNSADSNAVDMGNPDIGVLVKDGTGKILKPNDKNSTSQLTLSSLDTSIHRNAAIRLLALPISTTGKAPAVGSFDGVATLWLDME